jgi:hypothetical protein
MMSENGGEVKAEQPSSKFACWRSEARSPLAKHFLKEDLKSKRSFGKERGRPPPGVLRMYIKAKELFAQVCATIAKQKS